MLSRLDGRSLLRLSNSFHHPVAQMSKTVRPSEGLQPSSEKSLPGVCFVYVTDNNQTADTIKTLIIQSVCGNT